MQRRRRRQAAPWLWIAGSAVLILTSVAWLATRQFWALAVWELCGLTYVAVGLAVVWRGSRNSVGSPEVARVFVRFAWIAPLLASAVGVSAAVTALVSRAQAADGSSGQALLAIAASVGVVLSWTLLQVGFAEIYQSLDEAEPEVEGIEFPGHDRSAFVNYVYFAFTVGTAFATSDARVTTLAIRRVVLVHSIVAFFYNALVVATAIQVLQQLVSPAAAGP